MTPEKALYHKLMLTAGLTEQYDADLLYALETEAPYSDIILELSYCQSDLNKTISVLHNYTLGKTIDDNAVFNMVLSDLRNRYNSNSINVSETVNVMFKIANSFNSFYSEPWCYMEYIDDYYTEAEIGAITWNDFNQCFETFIQTGKFVNLWAHRLVKHKRTKKYWIELAIIVLLEIISLATIFYYFLF